MLARTRDGKYVQLNDSSVIISALSSFLVDPQKNDIGWHFQTVIVKVTWSLFLVGDIVKFYPVQNFTDVYGTVYDIANKYFLMFQDKKPKETKEVFE